MNRRTTSLIFTLLICLPFANRIGAARIHAGSGEPGADQLPTGQSISDRLIGDWHSAKFGTQTLSTHADGTAVLKMHLSTLAAVLYGRDVTLQLQWKLDGNSLTQRVVGGSPEHSVEKLTRRYGNSYSYRIVELTGSQLIVEDTSTGKTCCGNALPADATQN